jgi:hypothetical protein
MYWNQNFKDFLSPNIYKSEAFLPTGDIDEAHRWAKKRKSIDKEKIDIKAKEIYNKTSFLSPEMRSIFLPENENSDEILIWLNE